MICKFSLLILTVLGLSLAVRAQEKEAPVPVQIRAVLHDPVRPTANLFYTDKTGAVVQLNFRPHDLTGTFLTLPINGSLVLYDKAAIDPKNPAASLAASVKLPLHIKQAIVVVLPAPTGEKPAYRMLLIDDSENAFPNGESRVLPLIGVDTAILAGEHKMRLHPGIVTRVPPVRKVNEFFMAQTNFYYQHGGSSVVFAERQLQYVDVYRRLFIIHATPGALQPTVTTIVDTTTREVPR
jgi:hypothetical protein